MATVESQGAEPRVEPLLKPYRDASNAAILSVWEEFAAEHPVRAFPSANTMRLNARLFTEGKRYRYALALAGFRLLTGERPPRGLERAATWLEWYHLYTLFLDDIMDEDVRRRTLPSAWSADAKLYRGADANRPAVVFRTRPHRYGATPEDRTAVEAYGRHFAIAFQDRDDLLGAGIVPSEIGGSAEGDIRQGKRTRLYVVALQTLPSRDRAAFLRAYGRGPRSTKTDVRRVRELLRSRALPEMEKRIAANLLEARRALDRLPRKDPDARELLEALLDAQRNRVR